ncbi:cytochrome P450 6a2-like [Prorops nasuta]|uniref:cytochrome P450 6a2-like n=1 Tax=Prorops nasuta TaxID=863751 RepID=UPI0034CDCD23
MYLFILVSSLVIVFYLVWNFQWRYRGYWKNQGIPEVRRKGSSLKEMVSIMWTNQGSHAKFVKMYNENPGVSMVGFYQVGRPALLVREPGIIKDIMLVEFPKFRENLDVLDPKNNRLLFRNPFFSRDHIWKNSRKRLTNAFSSSRLKTMTEDLRKISGKMDDYLLKKLEGKREIELELKDLFSRFTGEFVANAGFGIEGYCFHGDKHPGSFHELGKIMFAPKSYGILDYLLQLFPVLQNIPRVSFLPEEVDRFFMRTTKGVLDMRMSESSKRLDFFQLMLDLESSKDGTVDVHAVASNLLTFFFDGYETAAITLSFVGYHLAEHPEVQERLRKEVKDSLSKCGSMTYECLTEMTYMDQVIHESLRMKTTFGGFVKICTESTVLKGSDGLSCRVEPGTFIAISNTALHKDPSYWKDPEVFDPSRFDPSVKSSIPKFTFLPFGEGPRICIGMRVGLLSAKAALFAILNNYSLEPSPRTQLPFRMDTNAFMLSPIGGIWARLKPLDKSNGPR